VQPPLTIRQRLSGLPYRLLIIAAALVVIALITAPLIGGLPDRVRTDNVLLTGVPFILTFVAIILAFAFLIVVAAKLLNDNVPPRIYQVIEWIIIGGIVVGVVGMFQPWTLFGYQVGFLLLFVCLLAFNVWSHVTPRRIPQAERVERAL
jgi:MFS family permease